MKKQLVLSFVLLGSVISLAQSPVIGVSAGNGTSANQTQGAAAAGTPVTGNPVLIGGSDGTNAQTAVSATSTEANGANTASVGILKVMPCPFQTTGQVRCTPNVSILTSKTATTLTGHNINGAVYSVKPDNWTVNSTPAVSTQASASIAAEASVRHVADTVCISAGATTAPALTNLQINIRDGATGAGTILMSLQVIIPATAVQHITPYCIPNLNLVGTTNTAMTAEWSALLTNEFEQITLLGYNVN